MPKIKQSKNKKSKRLTINRFDIYELEENFSDIKRTGLVNNDNDYDLGTPNLYRNEDVTFVSSNSSSKEALFIKFKWRPFKGSSISSPSSSSSIPVLGAEDLVRLSTEIVLEIGDQIYKHEQVVVYKPTMSSVRSNRITRYGSAKSNLRLIINAPYRRMRLLFNGFMENQCKKGSSNEGDEGSEVKFIKLNLVICPTGAIYDFACEYDEKYLSKQYKSKKMKCGLKKAIELLVEHDRHEQLVQIKGDCLIYDTNNNDNSNASKSVLYTWGFHIREFILDSMNDIKNNVQFKRILVHGEDGRAFNLVRGSLPDYGELEYGYTAFNTKAPTVQIAEKYSIDWTKVNNLDRENKFKLEVSNQDKTFACSLEPRKGLSTTTSVDDDDDNVNVNVNSFQQLSQFYNVTMNNENKGWAYILVNDDLIGDSNRKQDKQKVELSVTNYLKRLQDGKINNQLNNIKPATLSQNIITGSSSDTSIVSQVLNNNNNNTREDAAQQQQAVVNIEDFYCSSSSLVGSKAASLAQLRVFKSKCSINYKVPYAIVLTKYSYDIILKENPDIQIKLKKLEELAGSCCVNNVNSSNLKEECDKLENYIVNEVILPSKLRQHVSFNLTSHYGERISNLKFAVRSSSWGEDEEDMSAAGQLTTILGVSGEIDSISKAIMACFASKFNYSNIQYKRQHGLPLNLPMAVIIQEMIYCDKAGVMFTCDPTNLDDSLILITGNYGLGESVVSGQSEPDSIKVRRRRRRTTTTTLPQNTKEKEEEEEQLTIEDVKIGTKAIVIDSDTLEERKQEKNYDKSVCCLSESEILELAKCGLELDDYYQSFRDIEWGFKEGQLYLLQSRPITGLDSYTEFELMHENDLVTRAEVEYYTRANVGEVLPFAVKPFTCSYNMKCWQIFSLRFESQYRKNIKSSLECGRDFMWNAYHTFFTLRGTFMINFRKPNGDLHPYGRAIQIAFFSHDLEDQEDLVKCGKDCAEKIPINLLFFFLKIFTLDLRIIPERVVMREKKMVKELRSKVEKNSKLISEQRYSEDINTFADNNNYYHEKMSPGVRKMLQYYEQTKNLLECGLKLWRNHGMTIVISNEYNSYLLQLLSKYIKDKKELFSVIAKFLSISPNVISGEIPVRIGKIAELIKKQMVNCEKFNEMTTEQAIEYITVTNKDSQLSKEYQEFIELFGHRCYNEFDVSVIPWRDDQESIINMIKSNCQSSSNNNNMTTTTTTSNKETNDSIINSLNIRMSYFDKLRLKYSIVPACQRFVSLRERTKEIMIDHIDVLRIATRQLAREMCKNLRIPDEDLFYYLVYDEIEPLILEPQPGLVVQALKRRNMWKIFDKPWKYDEIIRDHKCIPNHMKESKELDERLKNSPKLYGTPASNGYVKGRVCLVQDYDQLKNVKSGDILVTHSTDIAFSPIFPLISGIVTEIGGLISHGAVVAREYGLPSIMGVPNVTKIIKHSEEIILDANNGVIIRLNNSVNPESTD